MKNILSYQYGTPFYGSEILAWAKFQITQKTSHYKQGLYILNKYGNINPNQIYLIQTSHQGTGCGEVLKEIYIQKYKEL